MTAAHPVLDRFAADLPYPLDDFQRRACLAIEAGSGVLVCAPTGAGKTVVGEFAVAAALEEGTKCFYTTPIKALSNQKHRDLAERYGEERVGLLTGDVSLNGGADIVVMTTEVLRNMIYAGSPQLDGLTHVVMDEIHFLADRERGAVWEEVILGLDDDVSVIGLSATVSNSEEFGRWLTAVRGDTDVIVSEDRPVPLTQHMLVGTRLHPLFEPGGAGDRAGRDDGTSGARAAERVNRDLLNDVAKMEALHDPDSRRSRRHRPPRRADVVRLLQSRRMLPAIVFIFSRAGCDGALMQLGAARLDLTFDAEKERIAAIVDRGVEGIPAEDLEVLDFRRWRRTLLRGAAAHHAGMLPAFRHIVEELFNEGLVKVVFATETLALGINMPARTVVLEKLVKYDGESHVDLTPGQYTQMTGRAGRRGIDVHGHAVVQWAPAMDPLWVAGLASTRTYPLESTFRPGYNMAVNLVRTLGLAEARATLEKSFAQFQADGDVVGDVRALERAELRVAELSAGLDAAGDVDGFLEYMDIRAAISAEEKEAKRRSLEDRHAETVRALGRLRRGEVIAIPRGKGVELAAIVREDRPGAADPRPLAVGNRGFAGRLAASKFPAAPQVLGRVKVPADAARKPRRAVGLVAAAIERAGIRGPRRLKRRAAVHSPKLKELRRQLRAHPLHGDPAVEAVAADASRLRAAQRDVARLRAKVAAAGDTLAHTFDRILDLLGEMDYVERDGDGPWRVTDEGERLARIHNPSDLLVAQCLRRGIWDDLDPAELAGAASTLVFETRRATRSAAEAPTDALQKAIADVHRIHGELVADERRHRLPETRDPDEAFAGAIHQWAAGAPLGYAIQAAAAAGAELTPGDFVRSCRQVVDLLQQIRNTGYSDDIRRNAGRAVEAIRRGVVALGA
ncbi:DEAD/DEAH box helicase [Corynebacterium sp. 335C]